MHRNFVWFSIFLVFGSLLHAADEQGASAARLRDALRQLSARVQAAESEAAALKATQSEFEVKNAALEAQLKKLSEQCEADKAAADKAAAGAEARLAVRDAEVARTREALDKWKAGHAQLAELVKKTEAARLLAVTKAAGLDLRAAELTRKNLALFKIGNEILTRLENFSYGTALAAREPFIGVARVKLENQVQGYKDQLLDPKLKP